MREKIQVFELLRTNGTNKLEKKFMSKEVSDGKERKIKQSVDE